MRAFDAQPRDQHPRGILHANPPLIVGQLPELLDDRARAIAFDALAPLAVCLLDRRHQSTHDGPARAVAAAVEAPADSVNQADRTARADRAIHRALAAEGQACGSHRPIGHWSSPSCRSLPSGTSTTGGRSP